MSDLNEKMESTEKDIQYFDKMVDGAERLVRPWKTAVGWLALALVSCNLIWGIVHFYHIKKAYEPTEMEITQAQDIPNQIQEQAQTIKGAN